MKKSPQGSDLMLRIFIITGLFLFLSMPLWAQSVYNYFAPGGALSCTGSCTQQTVDLTQSGFVLGPLSLAKGGTGLSTCASTDVLFSGGSAYSCSSKLTWTDSISTLTVAPLSTAATLQFGPRSFLETNIGQNFIFCQDNRPGFTHLVPGTNNCTIAGIINAIDDMQFIGANGPKFEFIAPTAGVNLGDLIFDFQNSSSDGWTFTFNDPAEGTCGEAGQPSWAFTSGQTECMFFNTEGLPFLLGPGNTDLLINSANTEMILAIGATPLKWIDVTNITGSNTTVLGDASNASSVTNIKGGSAANTQINGSQACSNSVGCPATSTKLTGTTGSIGGSALLAGACSSGTVSITGATTSMVAVSDPNTYPGDGNWWSSQVTSANTITVRVCASVAATPTASTYNVRVLQ